MHIRQLPLTALRAFAVTAQLGSVSRAADELGVSHGAVSRNISALETLLGMKLFDRRGKRLELTPLGTLFAENIGQSLRDIVTSCAEVGRAQNLRIISVEAPATFAIYWLLPRVRRYEKLVKNVEINVVTRMTSDQPGFSRSDVLITRDMHPGRSPNFSNSELLLRESMTVIATAAFIRRHSLSTVEDVLFAPRVASATRPEDWSQWIALYGKIDAPDTLRHKFDHLFVAMHAVADGFGSIVAPSNLFEGYGNARFITPFPELVFTGRPYFIHTKSKREAAHIRKFLGWLLDPKEGNNHSQGKGA